MPGSSSGVVISGKYRVVGPVGRGGMGQVYEAVNDAIGRRVALKLIDPTLSNNPEFLKRFELEAKAAALISHPGIVDVLDMGRSEDGSPFIVMEYLQGLTLNRLLRRVGKLSPGEASAAIEPVLGALAAAHAVGVVHRDLKPANVFVAVKPTEAVKVLDFGISKFGALGQRVTVAGTTLGTPSFMAPEQMRDGHSVGPAADLYSVGALLYALLTGRPPFESDSLVRLEAMVLTEPPRPLLEVQPGVPPALSALVDRLLEKLPERRPTSALQALQLLREAAPPTPGPLFQAARRLTPGLEVGPVLAGPQAPEGKTVIDAAPLDVSPGRSRGFKVPGVRRAIALGALAAVSGSAAWFVLAPPPAPAAEVTRSVRAEPASAEIRVRGGAAPCNPCVLRRPKGSAVELEVSAPGFSPVSVPLAFEVDGEVALALVPVPVAEAPQPPVPPAPAPPRALEPVEKGAPAGAQPPPAKKKELGLDKSNPYL